MTQEDKELLKDLCARLPYRVKILDIPANVVGDLFLVSTTDTVEYETNDDTGIQTLYNIKPYLFPLSSMTEEQLHELKEITDLKYNYNTLELIEWSETYKTLEFWLEEVPQYKVIEVFDWLNKNHFDYRGLIERGLAIDATGNYVY